MAKPSRTSSFSKLRDKNKKDIILVEIPEWAKERHIFVFAGSELLAMRMNGKFYAKVQRCSMCGRCCVVNKDWFLGTKPGDTVGFSKDELVCKYLERQKYFINGVEKEVYACTAGPKTPFGCNKGPYGNLGSSPPECTVRFKEVKK